MPKGDNNRGKRFGGRKKGTPNKRNTEAIEKMRIEAENAAHGHRDGRTVGLKKLGKDMLEDYMLAFHGVAAPYQQRIVEAVRAGRSPSKDDLDGFKEWGLIVRDTAKALADFQSPKFKAIAVVADPTATRIPENAQSAKVITMQRDPASLARVYNRMIQQGK